MIRLVAMDIDGTLTDGGFFMDGEGHEFKRFDVRDGYGIVMLMKSGVEVAFISGRRSKATEQRALDLGVAKVVNGTADKLPDLVAMAGELGLEPAEVAFIGDDVPDVECMSWAGLGMAVGGASAEALEAADWVSACPGGRGAVREAAEHILKLNSES